MAERHVRQGEAHIARQHALLAKLDAKGKRADQAMAFLNLLEDLQIMHRAHLSRLLRKASGG